MNKKIIIPIAAVFLLAIGLVWFFNQRRSDLTDELQANLSGEKSGVLANSNFAREIKSFYAEREYMEVWLFNGRISKIGEQMLAQIENSKYDGLQPEDYNLAMIYELSTDPEKENKKFRNLSSGEKLNLELLLTDAFFNLAHDLEKGKVNPSSLDPNWKFEEKETEINYTELLEEVANGSSVDMTFASLYPSSDLYEHGRDAIQELYTIQKNDTLTWEFEPVEGAIEVGEMHAAIPALRQRLIFWDFLEVYE